MSAPTATRPGDQVLAFEALWGLEGTLDERFAGIRRRGYVGVEAGTPTVLARIGHITDAEARDFGCMLCEYGLELLPMVFTFARSRRDPTAHADSLARQVDEVMVFAPRQITAHTGSDSMSVGESIALFEAALELQGRIGVPIGHETHRGRILHSPFAWRDVYTRLPELSTVADLAHWATVCGRLPTDAEDELASCCERAIHVHARVGDAEGVQVADPRRPEAASAVGWHERWWRAVFTARLRAGAAITFDPEYGPPPYLSTDLHTGDPLVDLGELRAWATERLHRIGADVLARQPDQ